MIAVWICRWYSRGNKRGELVWDDFEDAVQSVTAVRVHADYIITRNVRDFTETS